MEIYIARDGNRLGSFPLDEVRRQLASGQLTPNDLAWTQGARDWVPLVSFPPLQSNQYPPAVDYNGPRQPEQTSGLAIASLVCGILSLPF